MPTNPSWVLQSYPVGMPTTENWTLENRVTPQAKSG